MKSLRVYLIICGVLLLIYIVGQLNRPRLINWAETYNDNDKIPYGTYILHNQLKDVFPGAEIITFHQPFYNVIAEDSVNNASYVVICSSIEPSKTDFEQMMRYVKKGNDIFISAGNFGKVLSDKLNIKTTSDFKLADENAGAGFVNEKLNPAKKFVIGKEAGIIYFERFDTLKAIVLGENTNHKANFIKYSFGKGNLYLHSASKFFTNYSLLQPQGEAYAALVLSYLKNTRQLIWDEYYSQGEKEDQSPMRIFLTVPELQWAYYLTLFSLVAFILYDMKRRQRIIPVIEPLGNSTLEFVNVVGQVYYEQRDNSNIAHKKILYLLEHLRDKYNIKTSPLDEEFTNNITGKLGLEKPFAIDFTNYIKSIGAKTKVTDTELIQLNKLIEQLYTQSR